MINSDRDDKIMQLKAKTKEWGEVDDSDPKEAELRKERAKLLKEVAELNVPILETQRNKRIKQELGKYAQQRRARGNSK